MGPLKAQAAGTRNVRRFARDSSTTASHTNVAMPIVRACGCAVLCFLNMCWILFAFVMCLDHCWIMFGSFWDHVGSIGDYVFIYFWNVFGVILDCLFNMFGIILGSFADRLGIVLGSCWDHAGIVVASSWDRFGIVFCDVLESFWARVGSFWDSFGIVFGSV